jgi:hypothetical protein
MPPKPVTDVITSGPTGPDAAQAQAMAAAQGAQPRAPEPRKEDPDPAVGEDERVTALNTVVADYAKAVSTSVTILDPLMETVRAAQREAEAHPELPMGEAMAGNMRTALAALDQVYELLRRVGAPSAPQA